MKFASSRRQFLAQSVAATGGAFLTSVTSTHAAPEETSFRIGVCDWTLKKAADPESLEIAKRIGLDGVEVDLGSPGKEAETLPLSDDALQKEFLERSAELKVEIPSLAMGVLNSVPFKSDPRAEKWVHDSVDIAKAMGVKVVLLAFFGKGDLRDDADGKAETIKRLKKLAPKAEAAGVTYGIESYLSANELIEILDAVGSKNVQAYYDVGNMHKVEEDIYTAIVELGRERIIQFHAKDYDDLYGKGTIDFPRVRKSMDAIGYRGWMMMEGVKMPLGVEESCKYDGNYLRTIFPR